MYIYNCYCSIIWYLFQSIGIGTLLDTDMETPIKAPDTKKAPSTNDKLKQSWLSKATDISGLEKGELPLWLMIALSLVVSFLLVALTSWSQGGLLISLHLLLGVCAGSVGGIIGFLFGIPHSATLSSPATYRPSTNLEQVSDWLTKIIIGVGLVQADEIATRLAVAGRLIGTIVPGASPIVPQIIIVAFAALGFFSGYIWTRLYYGGMQVQADHSIQTMLANQSRLADQFGQLQQVQQDIAAQTEELAARTNELDETTNLLAGGKIGTATPAVASISNTETETEAARAVQPFFRQEVDESNIAINDLNTRLANFMAVPIDYESDPGADLFKDLNLTKTANGRQLSVEILTKLSRGLTLQATVKALDSRPLEGEVLLLLHPTYSVRIVHLPVTDGSISFNFFAVGWFTLVAVVDGGKTLLTYDLRDVPGAPDWFTKG